MAKKNVGVMFGGRSVEHEVSVITGLQVIENLDKSKYTVTPIFVSKEGDWYTGEELMDIKNYKDMDGLLSKAKKVFIPPVPSAGSLHFFPVKSGLFRKEAEPVKLDVIFPAFHGTYGEDGCMQGLFKLADIPYVGCGVTGSSVGMDKIIMKDIFKANNIPTVNYTWFYRKAFEAHKSSVLSKLEGSLKYPMFVKPANLGSSIGIGKARNQEQLAAAIEIAGKYDRKIIVEEGVENLLEVNCSVAGAGEEVEASLCEQPVSWEDFLSFDDKYMRGNSSKGMKSTTRRIPAPIPEAKTAEVRNLAMKVFKVLDCSGVSRVDFLLEKDTMKVYVNEINTMPGSIAFYLWEPMGVSFKELLDRLIKLALEDHGEHSKNMYSFNTALLLKASTGSAKGGKSGK